MKYALLSMTGAALAIFTAGCAPELAQVTAGADDLEWKEFAAGSYSGYRPPRVTSPAEKDKYQGEVNPAGAAADPAPAAEDPNSKPAAVEEETPAAKPAVKEEVTVTEEAPAKQEQTPAAKDGKAEEKTAEAAKIEAAPADADGEVYVVKSGDTLSGLAKKFYKDGNMSGIIFKANSKVLKNPNALRPGMKLVIPKM